MLQREINILENYVKRLSKEEQEEKTLPYLKQMIRLHKAHTRKLEQKLSDFDTSSMNTFNILMLYPLVVDLEDVQERLGYVYSNLAQTYEKLAKHSHKKELYTAASQFYTDAGHYAMKYINISDNDQEYDWVSKLLKNAAEAIAPVNPIAAAELRLKSEQAHNMELDDFDLVKAQ
jgi:hypothetical protein